MREGSRIASAFFLQHLSLLGMNESTVPPTTTVPHNSAEEPHGSHQRNYNSGLDSRAVHKEASKFLIIFPKLVHNRHSRSFKLLQILLIIQSVHVKSKFLSHL